MAAPESCGAGRGLGDLSGCLTVALLAGEDAGVERTLREALSRGADLAVVARDVIGPALSEVGDMWVRGDISPADEHLATALVSRVLARIAPAAGAPPLEAPRILFSCLQGEFHELGLRIVTEIAIGEGWSASTLGANVPRAALVRLVAERPPDALGLSAALAAHIPECLATARQVRASVPGTRILLGGCAFREGAPWGEMEGVDAVFADVVALRDWLRSNRPTRSCAPGPARPSTLPAGLKKRLAGGRRERR